MKKCIILYTANYCAKIKNYFCVDDLILKGVDIEFWDLGAITLNEHLAEVESPGLVIRKIKDKEDYEHLVKVNNEAVFFSFMNYTWYSFVVYRILSKYNCDIIYCTSGCLPPLSSSRLFKKIMQVSLKQIFLSLKYRYYGLLKKTNVLKPAKMIMKSCRAAECDYKVSDKTIFLGCNSGDYQKSVSTNSLLDRELDNGRYVVYIDQYLPFHNDFTLRGIKHINADVFYKSINLLFDIIEQKYKCKVVIAAHPSSMRYKVNDYFHGRKVVYNQTSEMINHSVGAITCCSTAIAFPVIKKIPVMLYTSDDIIRKYKFFDPALFSQLLDLPFFNIDKDRDFSFRGVNVDRYNKYKYEYLTTPISEKFNNSDIIISILDNNYQKYIYHE